MIRRIIDFSLDNRLLVVGTLAELQTTVRQASA